MKFEKYSFEYPTPKIPYYHLRLSLTDLAGKGNHVVTGVTVDGVRSRDFDVFNDGEKVIPAVFKALAVERLICVRIDWTKGQRHEVSVMLFDAEDKTYEVTCTAVASGEHGYWNRQWKYYASHVLEETIGLERVQEPVHVILGLYSDRIQDPEAEIRVVAIHSKTGIAEEIPSQVYGVSKWEKWTDIHCQPTTTVELAFSADVAAYEKKVFLIFYGNPEASKPLYPSDLKISGSGYALTVENKFYRVSLHSESGSIDEIVSKDASDVTFCHHLETNGTMQWNPDVYAPPKTWMHSSDWVAPEDFTVISGPVFVMVKRYNPIVDYEEVDCSITYLFYSNNQGISIESNIDVNKDLDVVALRNGSVVLNKETTGDFAWMGMDSRVRTVHITDMPRHPVKGMTFDARTPWYSFFNAERNNALGVLNLEFNGIRRQGGLLEWEPYFYLHWGPWFYVSRPIIYTFTSNNPQRVMHMSAGTSFHERYQLVPFTKSRQDDGCSGFSELDTLNRKARVPLSKLMAKFDTDTRVPDEWIPPILVSHFEELVD
ncbi:hypothetical protein [Parasphaerochaeta coccoides]|uniref:Uncharacterized protein n=1 Tax=Parasphaerochaeta coccoides (strain ATCC BAA-1237 / DSM 17374 / SPN1) TaxID=760011 RepID=F4GHI2_PARC1|nr:hypothetical protein [Parasphaerochaeta coccoides]AEC02571.1 hypothetical protein Spico_1366 [Parasphaerochaeta coccoides DSM 17374]